VTAIFGMDVRDANSVQAMVDFVVNKYGRLNYAVNCAGVSNALSFDIFYHGPDGSFLCCSRLTTANMSHSQTRTSPTSTAS
jgi:NAD(P)-dependent dehydrogenase (short-subunit alcohol dehydrogenase family)